MSFDSASISLLGDRQENQDRVAVIARDGAALLVVIDGMGGHAGGALAAEVALETIEQAFAAESLPVFDPQGFLHLAIGRAHAAVVEIGADVSVEARPRATCALCLVQNDAAFWAHVGDSRVYHLRDGEVHARTLDHSHVEVLLHDGVITREELASHPMRNYVECCLGGDAEVPRMSISVSKPMKADDLMLVCSDGFWSPIDAVDIGGLSAAPGALEEGLRLLGKAATKAAAPHSDNTSAAALRLCG